MRVGEVAEEAAAEVLVEGRGLGVEVRHGQVGQTVGVEVSAGHAHAGLIAPLSVGADSGDEALLLEPETAEVAEEEVGGHVVGDIQVEEAVEVQVDGHDAQASAILVDGSPPQR